MFTASGAFSGSLAPGENGTLYAASDDGFAYAIDSWGSLQWKFQSGPLYAAPSLGEDGTIYIANRDEHIFAINPRSGTLQRAAAPMQTNTSPGAAAPWTPTIFYTPFRGSMRGIRRTTGALDWIAGEGFKVAGSASILPTGLVVFPSAGRVDAANSGGIVVWRYPVMDLPLTVDLLLENRGHAPLGNFWLDSGIALGTDGTLYMAAGGSRGDWSERRTQVGWGNSSPTLAPDGTLYAASRTGESFFHYPWPPDESPCPKFQHDLANSGRAPGL
jgi:outer membrane protein assembly factor BamB